MANRIPALSGLYNYAKLTKNSTDYAKRMQRLSNGIFNEYLRETEQITRAQITRLASKPHDLNPEVVNYYPRHEETAVLMRYLRDYGLFRDEHRDFYEEMRAIRRLKGKGKKKK